VESDEEVEMWLARLSGWSHYELLEVGTPFEPSVLQAAFHRFSQRFHPDQHVGADETKRSSVRRIFMRGAEAYRVLKNPKLRRDYDLGLATAAPAAAAEGRTRPRGLEEICQTAAGRLHARQADSAISEGRLHDAAALLDRALRVEGANPELRERLDSVRMLLSLCGES